MKKKNWSRTVIALLLLVISLGVWFGADRGINLVWLQRGEKIVAAVLDNLYQAKPHYETALEHAVKHLDPAYYCPMHPQVTSHKLGRCPICGMDLVSLASAGSESGAVTGEREILYYRNPMGQPDISPVPKKDSMGMDYIPVYEDETNGDAESGVPTIVTVQPEVVNNLGVRTEKVERTTLSRRIDTVGYVGYNESLIGHVHLRTEGWIERLAVNTIGDRVARGDLLFTLYSPTLVNAQEEFLQAYERGNERLINASRQKLKALGVSTSQIEALTQSRKAERTISVFAHQAGVVSDLKVREGMYVEPATETMTLVDLGSVWLLAEVFERYVAWVEAGQQAEARIPSMPERIWKGSVDYIYPDLDPVTRTLKVRLRFDNPDEALKPNMFAHINILASPRMDVLTVPRDAVIRDGEGERVILALGEGRFAPRAIITGIESDERVEVLEGLAEGDQVVVSAQFLLDSEASLKASFRRMTPMEKRTIPPLPPSPIEGQGGGGNVEIAP
ncbi:MAG: efflux RND transporter periplasmic adaptor subunit [Gammaproteobacteria bacterium]|nr:efflux RND transporter periplasmic adaptor subunit [Gammaproteobacteria bacterium]